MILHALTRYYEILVNDPTREIARFGYSTVGVSYALNISTTGELLDILPLFDQVPRGKKLVEVPRPMFVPEQVKRSGTNPTPNFLWDNAAFVLGLSDKGSADSDYGPKRYDAFHRLHQRVLAGVESPAARALLAFLARHNPHTCRQHPVIAKQVDLLLNGANLVFRYNGVYLHDDPVIRQTWAAYKEQSTASTMQCLVTGEIGPIARLHPTLKRVRGAQAMGVTLVGFNAAAYESYHRTQGLNSPVGEAATFAYTTALNYLLSNANPNKKFYWGDTTVVYWAESKNRAYESAFAMMVDPEYVEEDEVPQSTVHKRAEAALKSVAEKVKRTQMLDLDALLADLQDGNPRFYVLGLAPNAARVSVRFFIAEPFTKIVENIKAHYQDLAIIKEYANQPTYLTVGHLLGETVSKKARDKEAAPLLAGAVLRAVLTHAPYPAALYNAVLNRIRADMDDASLRISKINYVRAAVIKAFLLRKYRSHTQNPFKEVLTMPLNEQSTLPAYLLGRLFAVLEKVQQEAIGDVNASIKDRYFTSACAAPRSVFPTLLRLAQHHIAKAKYGYASDRRIQEILNLLDVERNPMPARLTLDEQGVFILGYYHQRAAFYAKASEAANPTSETAPATV